MIDLSLLEAPHPLPDLEPQARGDWYEQTAIYSEFRLFFDRQSPARAAISAAELSPATLAAVWMLDAKARQRADGYWEYYYRDRSVL